MLRRLVGIAVLVLPLGHWCRADVTLRYTQGLKFGGALAAAGAVLAPQIQSMPPETFIRIRGNKAASKIGPLIGISDTAAGEITLLNPATKQHARMPIADFEAAKEKMSARSQAALEKLRNMSFDVQNHSTGEVATICGLRAEEHLVTMAASINAPTANTASRPLARVEAHTWVVSAEELKKTPALGEYAAYIGRALGAYNLADTIQKMFGQIPGFAGKLREATDVSPDTHMLVVKAEAMFYSPAMALQRQAPTPGAKQTADPDAPVIELYSELAEISTDRIDVSVFEVPAGYEETSPEEILKALRPAQPAPAPPVASRPDLGPNKPLNRAGGISPPSVISRLDPAYTEEARRARISGSVLLSIIVDTEGNARNIQVVRSLDPGLDQKAIEAVSSWKFRPGQKNGQPVNVRAQVEVNFRLVDRPPAGQAPE